MLLRSLLTAVVLFFATPSALALAAFQTLYALGLARSSGPSPRREAYLLVGITANLLVLGVYAVTRTWGIPFFGPYAGELEPFSGPDLLAAALEAGALVLLTRVQMTERGGYYTSSLMESAR